MLFLNTLQVNAQVTATNITQAYNFSFIYSLGTSNAGLASGYISNVTGGGGTINNGTGTISSNSGGGGSISSSLIIDGQEGITHFSVPLTISGSISGSALPRDYIYYITRLLSHSITCSDGNVHNICLKNADGRLIWTDGTSDSNLVTQFGLLSEMWSSSGGASYNYYLDFDVSVPYSSNSNHFNYTVTCSFTTQLYIGPSSAEEYQAAQPVQDSQSHQKLDDINSNTSSTAQSSSGILSKVTEFFGSFFSNLIGVFVPEDGYFSNWFIRLNTLLADKLGMLYAPFDLLIQVLTSIMNADSSFAGIPFPGIQWEDTWLVEPFTFTFDSLGTVYTDLQGYVYFGTDVLLLIAFFGLLQDKIKHILED